MIHVSRCELCTEKGEGDGDVIKTEKMERRPPREGGDLSVMYRTGFQ